MSFEDSCVTETGLSDFHKMIFHGNEDILSENWAKGYKLLGLKEFI